MKTGSPKYQKIHAWLKKIYGKADRCENENCTLDNPKRFEWTKLHEFEYDFKRENFTRLCKSCHVNYDMTDEWKNNIGNSHRNPSKETRQKIAIAKIGDKNPSYGQPSWNSGKKIGANSKGHNEKISSSMKGKKKPPRTLKHCKKISDARKGKNNPFYGKAHTKESRRKMRKAKQIAEQVKNELKC